jgi:hypothetical protein
MLRIDTIVLSVCPDESNIQNSEFVIDLNDESKFVASDIENNAIFLKKTRMLVTTLDVLRSIPDPL